MHAPQLIYEILRRFSQRASSRVFPFLSHRSPAPPPPPISFLLFSLVLSFYRSLLIAKCRNILLPELFSSRSPNQLSRSGIARVALCALSRGPSCSLAGSRNWISRLARQSQGDRRAIPRAFLVSRFRR